MSKGAAGPTGRQRLVEGRREWKSDRSHSSRAGSAPYTVISNRGVPMAMRQGGKNVIPARDRRPK